MPRISRILPLIIAISVFVSAPAQAAFDCRKLLRFLSITESTPSEFKDRVHQAQVHRPWTAKTGPAVRQSAKSSIYQVERPLMIYLKEFENFANPDDRLLRFLTRTHSDDKVVDLGCGEGYALEQLFQSTDAFYRETTTSPFYRSVNASRELQTDLRRMVIKNQTLRSTHAGETDFYVDLNEFLSRPFSERPQAVGVTYEIHRQPPKNSRLKILRGKFFERVDLEEIGEAKVLLDFFGVGTYLQDKNWYLASIAALLPPGGRLYTRGTTALSQVGEMNYGEWLKKNLSGFRVTNEADNTLLERLDGPVRFPKLEFVGQDGSVPPRMLYRPTREWIQID